MTDIMGSVLLIMGSVLLTDRKDSPWRVDS